VETETWKGWEEKRKAMKVKRDNRREEMGRVMPLGRAIERNEK
jgi:hypothetical protein